MRMNLQTPNMTIQKILVSLLHRYSRQLSTDQRNFAFATCHKISRLGTSSFNQDPHSKTYLGLDLSEWHYAVFASNVSSCHIFEIVQRLRIVIVEATSFVLIRCTEQNQQISQIHCKCPIHAPLLHISISKEEWS